MVPAANGLAGIWLSGQTHDYFPLTFTSFWLEWRLWGMNPAGYHAINVLLHAAASVLLWRVLLRLHIPGAGLAALLFALHPVNVASVAWISERKNTLSMVFYLASALAYLRFEDGSENGGRRALDTGAQGPAPLQNANLRISGQWFYGLALFLFLCALLSKTSVVMLPAILLLCAWWRRGRITWKDVWRSVPFFLLALAMGLLTVWFQNHRAIGGAFVPMGDFPTRLATAGWAAAFYLFKLLLPFDLSMLYPRWRIDPRQIQWLLPGMALAAALAAAFLFRRAWGRPLLFGLGYFLITLFPVLGFFRMYYFRLSPVADHWQYAAQIGIIALAAAAWVTLWHRLRRERTGKILAGGAAIFLAILTWNRSQLFESEEKFWMDVLKKDPQSWTANTNLALDLLEKKRFEEALVFARKPVEIEPTYIEGHMNLGAILDANKRFDEAAAQYLQAVNLHPDSHAAWRELAIAFKNANRPDDAILAAEEAVRLKPRDFQVRTNAGGLFYELGCYDKAIFQFEQAVRLNPGSADAHNNLAGALYLQNRLAEAIAEYQAALRLRPGHADARKNLEILLKIQAAAR